MASPVEQSTFLNYIKTHLQHHYWKHVIFLFSRPFSSTIIRLPPEGQVPHQAAHQDIHFMTMI